MSPGEHLTWPGHRGVSREFLREVVTCGPSPDRRSGPGGETAQVLWGERRGVARGAREREQSRRGHRMPSGEAQVLPRTEQISRELNLPDSLCAKNGFQAAVLKVWPRNPGGPISENPGDQTIFMIILRTHAPSSVLSFCKRTVEFLSGYLAGLIEKEWMQKQRGQSSCLLLSQTSKRNLAKRPKQCCSSV